MSNTVNISLPYLAAGQAQKHVTLNESLRILDALVHLSVVTRGLSQPPASPAAGQRYIVGTGASGPWSGWSHCIAAFVDGSWVCFTPRSGWLAHIADEDRLLAYDGTVWREMAGNFQNLVSLGVNALSDTTNRFAVAAPASLFNHEGGSHRMKVNKAAADQTASLLLQNGFSGRAEIGLTGDDRLHIKTSADGSQWRDTVIIDPVLNSLGVGLGQSGLSAQFQVESNSTATGWFVNTQPVSASAGAGMIGYTWGTPASSGDRLGFVLFGSRGGGQTFSGSGNVAGISGHAETAWALGSSHSAHLRFETTAIGQTGRSEKVRITGDGRVGIGTTTPSCALHVEGAIRPATCSVAGLPAAATSGAGALVYVSNEAGGGVLAFSDGTNWRRVTDRAVVS